MSIPGGSADDQDVIKSAQADMAEWLARGLGGAVVVEEDEEHRVEMRGRTRDRDRGYLGIPQKIDNLV
jgi:hypothetical protein